MIDHPTLERFASQLAGTSVAISCDAPSTFKPLTLGYVDIIGGHVQHVIHLPRTTCVVLLRLNDPAPRPSPHIFYALTIVDNKVADEVDGEAVLTFMHEVQHIALDSTDEGCVEATAYANVYQAVRLWKLAAWKVAQILRGAKFAHSNKPDAYLTGCPA